MFPMSEPKFLVLVSLDEPHGIAETGGYATGGMVSAPSVKAIIENIIALYGILPGDWSQTPLEIASTPVASPQLPPAPVVAASRGRGAERKALSARPAPAVSGVRHVAAE
jgi:cell division protein FtsI (penicillin-binding protein 3)